jgi:hypothetical protein
MNNNKDVEMEFFYLSHPGTLHTSKDCAGLWTALNRPPRHVDVVTREPAPAVGAVVLLSAAKDFDLWRRVRDEIPLSPDQIDLHGWPINGVCSICAPKEAS